MSNWIHKWHVAGSRPGTNYTVAVSDEGNWGCSCPAWTRHKERQDCKHIKKVRSTEQLTDAVIVLQSKHYPNMPAHEILDRLRSGQPMNVEATSSQKHGDYFDPDEFVKKMEAAVDTDKAERESIKGWGAWA